MILVTGNKEKYGIKKYSSWNFKTPLKDHIPLEKYLQKKVVVRETPFANEKIVALKFILSKNNTNTKMLLHDEFWKHDKEVSGI
jgi:hypothetical protein